MNKEHKKLPYKKPEFNFFSAKELDTIQAMMSGGSGGGETITWIDNLLKKHSTGFDFTQDYIYDIRIYSSLTIGITKIYWFEDTETLEYRFGFLVLADSRWGLTSPGINDYIISGLGIRMDNASSSDFAIMKFDPETCSGGLAPADSGSSAVRGELEAPSNTFLTLLTLATINAPNWVSVSLTTFEYIMAIADFIRTKTGTRKYWAWSNNVRRGVLYCTSVLRVKPGEKKKVDVCGAVASPYSSSSIYTPTIKITVDVPNGINSDNNAENYVTYTDISSNS